MTSITVTATIGEDRRLEIDLPKDIPIGPVELVIKPLSAGPTAKPQRTRDEIRARLKAAGILSEGWHVPEDAEPLSDEELEKLGQLFAGPQPISDLIDEDRGPRRAFSSSIQAL